METLHMSKEKVQPDAQEKQEYEQYVKSVTPTHNLWAQMGKAFLTGGIICCIGQGILNYTGNVLGMDPQTSGSWCSLIWCSYRWCSLHFTFIPRLPNGEVPELWCQSPESPIP